MKVMLEVELKPFTVPNFAVCLDQDEGKDRSFPLSVLDGEALHNLCEDFVNAVYKKAAKNRPARPVPCTCSGRNPEAK